MLKKINLFTFSVLFFSLVMISSKIEGKESLANGYSFRNAFDSGYGGKGRKWVSITAYYDNNFDDFQSSSEAPFTMGWGAGGEIYFVNYLSFAVKYFDTYELGSGKYGCESVYFGPRLYMGFLYIELGTVSGWEKYNGQRLNQFWDMYYAFGGNFPLSKMLAIDSGFTVTFGFSDTRNVNYNLYIGIKLTI